jgi:hypothetical protein
MGQDISFGAVGLSNTVYNGNRSRGNNSALPQQGNIPTQIVPVRVKSIILDSTHPNFSIFGEWNGIGTIFWEAVDKPLDGFVLKQFAQPIFSNIKNYPLINELIYIIQLPTTNISSNLQSKGYYYFPPINVWNSQIHNAMPSYDNDPSNDASQLADYSASFQGEVRQVKDNSTEINLGRTFQEKIDIHPLLPYEGDIIYEGRSGNSIRLGSTVNNSTIPNNWSSVGKNGDPIFILRNGQATYTSDPWIPEVEDINNDPSSIYLTSTQQLPLFPASVSNFAFSKSTPPTNVGQYGGNQIILNSGRLVLNAKSDSILLLASKIIQLSCNETLGIDAKQIALTAGKVYLGSSEGVEGSKIQSVVLGENLNFVLENIAVFLQTLNIAFKTSVDSNGAPIVSLQAIASDTETLSNDLLNIVNAKNLLSKTVKTV